jgi:hypothetical protein
MTDEDVSITLHERWIRTLAPIANSLLKDQNNRD